MQKFIRLDMKGHWRGAEHRSSVQGMGEEYGTWEEGISCYSLNDKVEAIENLKDYWVDIATKTEASDYADMQVTIFEGEKLDGMGGDWEDMAICTRTIAEFDAEPFMEVVLQACEDKEFEDITEEEFSSIVEKLLEDKLNG